MIQTSSNFAAFNTLALYRNQPCEVTSTRGHKDRVVCDRAGAVRYLSAGSRVNDEYRAGLAAEIDPPVG